jgi:hypothetical protein
MLALLAAFGQGGETTDKKGAVSNIAGQPFGEFALVVIGVGLLAYAMWRYLCAFKDADNEGSDAKGLGKRAAHLFSGIIHTSLGIYALQFVMGNGAGGGDEVPSWTARAMQVPAGKWLIAALGVAVIIGGIEQIREAIREQFMRHLRTNKMSRDETKIALRVGKWGYWARGIVFAITGVFLVYAGLTADPNKAQGLEGVLDTIAARQFGQLLLALVAAGLAAYGVYCFVEAKYRRVSM